MQYWHYTESLAAFYFEKVFPNSAHPFIKDRSIIKFYMNKSNMSAKELFLEGIKAK